FLAAPAAEHDVRRAPDHLGRVGDDAVAGEGFFRAFRKDVVAARDPHEFGDPADARDHRLVPLFEVDAWPPRQPLCRILYLCNMLLRVADQCCRLVRGSDQRAEPADIVEDAGDRTVIADPDLDPGSDQFARDVGLDVGKADDEVGLELEDLADLRARERRDLGLFPARARRPYGESRDADDAPLFADRVEDLSRLLGQADDALR